MIKLTDIALINPENIGKQTEINYIDIASVGSGKIFAIKNLKSEFPSRAKRKIIKGDIIISTVRPNLRTYALIETDLDNLVCSTGFVVIRPKNTEYKDILYHILTSKKAFNFYEKNCEGGNYPAFKSSILNNFEINPINSINKSLDILKKQNIMLCKFQHLLEKIEIRNQYYADKLLNGEISIDENGKVSNLKAELVNFKLFELFDFRMGQTILGKDVIKKDDSEKEVDTQIPVYSATENDVPFGFIDISKVNKLLNENDIIISARGTIGFPKLNNIKQKTSTQTTIQMISKGLISSYMVKKCINVKKDYYFSSEGAAVPQLTINTLSNKIIEIVKDTSNVESFLKKLDNEKEKVERLLKLEEQRFEWLSDKLLSGEYIIED